MPRKSGRRDPYRAREAKRYDHPIPSRELILEVLTERGKPLRFEELAGELGVDSDYELEALSRRLRAMERDGQIVRNRKGAYLPVSGGELVTGHVIAHPDGFGFLQPDEGGEDVFLSPREMRTVMHGDRVVVRVVGVDRRGRKEGSVVEVLERRNQEVVGRFYMEGGIGFVIPDNKRLTHDILIPPEHRDGAEQGQIVVAAILAHPTPRTPPIGRIVEVLGAHMEPGMEIDVAIRSHGLPHEWPEAVREEAERIPEEVPEQDKQGRVDLRKLPLVTIDGEDARDFDDAVYCEPLGEGKGWKLIVAIADVSAYVEVDSALDREARNRGTSVYFPERVIPMLPEVLSNGLCSLNPQVDRLCMVCEMQVDPNGQVKGYRFYEGLMRSAARLTYDEVAAMILEGDKALRKRHRRLVPHLEHLFALYRALRRQRERRGAIDFETVETKIEFGPERKIERIVPVERNDAHKLIEECMIAANVCAAKFLRRHRMPTLYRIHDRPDAERIEDLRSFLAEFGLKLEGGDEPKPKHFAKLLKKIQDRPEAHLIQTVMLRTLPQAVYSPERRPHFGLALEIYAHFTSPIRRYPDLLVHRGIRHRLRGGKPSAFHYTPSEMQVLGEHCSMTERRADEATRDAVLWLKCEYMMDKVGEAFDGIVSGVTSFGLFVELTDIYVDGLVHVTTLPEDYYHFDPIGHRLKGERSGRVYRLGDRVRVQVARVDLDERKIDLVLAAETPEARAEEQGAGRKKKSRRRRGRKKKARA
jgi:ribonuclease R